jgi:hypothetical protein
MVGPLLSTDDVDDRVILHGGPTDDLDSLRRLAIACVVAAVLLAVVSTAFALVVTGGSLEAFLVGDPATVLGAGASAAPLWRWAMLLDMFYSYLLLVPLALFVHRRLRARRPWLADLGLFGAAAYIVAGGASAAILGIAGSSLIESYATASAADQVGIAASFALLRDSLFFGVWQTFDALTAGTWVLSTGVLLLADRSLLGRLLVLLGVGIWLFACATMLGIHSLPVLAAIIGGVLLAWIGWTALARRPRDIRPGTV